MIDFFSRYKVFGIVFLILSAIIIGLFYNALKQKEVLPIFNPIMIDPSLVDESIQQQKKYHKIADFKLVNQNGDTITQKDYEDKIYVADFFFTTCQSICPIMTKNMGDIQKMIMNDPEIKLLSHTVTPEIDSVAQLNKYAADKGVISEKWNLVTGDKKQIYELARKSYMAVQDDGDGGPYDMIHTENFMLVDKEKRVRGYYDGTKEEEIEKLLKDIKILKENYVD